LPGSWGYWGIDRTRSVVGAIDGIAPTLGATNNTRDEGAPDLVLSDPPPDHERERHRDARKPRPPSISARSIADTASLCARSTPSAPSAAHGGARKHVRGGDQHAGDQHAGDQRPGLGRTEPSRPHTERRLYPTPASVDLTPATASRKLRHASRIRAVVRARR
jgi:hypothetical protein